MRLNYPADVKIIQVPCTGRVDIIHLLNALEDGADGVYVAGCLEDECHYIEGNLKARRKVEYVKRTLEELGIEQPALDRLTLLCYETLGLMSYFTVGEDEVRAWTIRQGALAPVAGGVIHGDIERGFIRAEVMQYDDLMELGSEQKVKAAGKFVQKGRDAVIDDGDIIHFLFKV